MIHRPQCLLGILIVALLAAPIGAQPRNGWAADWFAYDRAEQMAWDERTPTAEQLSYRARPPVLSIDAAPQRPAEAPAAATLEGLPGTVLHLRFRDAEGADVPVLLAIPERGEGPFPVAVALHGLGSHKGQALAQMGVSLLEQGFAVLAPDVPLHGERPGNPREFMDHSQILPFVARVKQSVQMVRMCIDLAEQHQRLDTTGGVVIAGYSLGAVLGSLAGPADPRISAMVLMVGGTTEFPRGSSWVPHLASIQPQLALPHFAGRPILMLNGRQDQTITPEMTQRLFDAAAEPKELIWYDAGHFLPREAYTRAARWLKERREAGVE